MQLAGKHLARDAHQLIHPLDTPPYCSWGPGRTGPPETCELRTFSNPSEALAIAPLLDPGVVVLTDTGDLNGNERSDCSGIGVRTAYPISRNRRSYFNESCGDRSILVLHCCDGRSQAAQEELLTVPAPIGKLWPLLSAADPARGFQPMIGLVTLGEIDAATLTGLGKGKAHVVVLSGEACINFMPVLRHRPMRQRLCAEKASL